MTEYETKLVAALRESVKSLEWAATIIGDIPPKSHYMESLQEARDLIAKAEVATLEPIYFMRDNHTFKRLSSDVSTALVEIEMEFNDGWTYGALCSKRKDFPTVHASGSAKRLDFFHECQRVLEAAHGIEASYERA